MLKWLVAETCRLQLILSSERKALGASGLKVMNFTCRRLFSSHINNSNGSRTDPVGISFYMSPLKFSTA